LLMQVLRHFGYESEAVGICEGEEVEVWYLHSKVFCSADYDNRANTNNPSM
jgi:hypothetical protein